MSLFVVTQRGISSSKKFNAKVIITSKNHKQGGDRIFEAYKKKR